jgi:hypothetical protein
VGRGPARARHTAREGPGGVETRVRRGRWRAGGTGDRGAGRRVWAARAGVGRPRKGGSWAGPESNSADFVLK